MINNLNEYDNKTQIKGQICIIGAGTVGLFLANELANRGINTIVIEAGDTTIRTPKEKNYECIHKGIKYSGSEDGRAFGIGGTSALWGGQMIPLVKSDLQDRSYIGYDKWPIKYKELEKYFEKTANILGLGGYEGKSDYKKLLDSRFSVLQKCKSDFDLRLSQWLPFEMRNMSKAFSKNIENNSNIQIYLNAMAYKLEKNDQNSITKIIAKNNNNIEIEFIPEQTIISLGALESTRLLLEFDEQNDYIITKEGSPLGKFFADHLSVNCGKFQCKNWNKFNMLFSPIFEKGIMRTPRLELKSNIQKEEGLSSAFAHFSFVTNGDTGFDLVRSILRKNQGKNNQINLSLNNIFKSIKDITSLIWWRYIKQRLWIPRKAELSLQVDIEQIANEESRLSLDNTLDKYGRKKLIINWKIQDKDFEIIRKVTKKVEEFWLNTKLDDVATLKLNSLDNLESFNTPYDVYHPTGTIRMGNNIKNSVVDADLKIWNLNNCYVNSTAVFPSPGSANPGMVSYALTLKLADHLHTKIKESR